MGTDGCLQSESGVAENSEGFGQSGWSGDHLCWFASFTSKDNYRWCSIGEKKDKSLLEDLDNGCVNKQAIRLRRKGSTISIVVLYSGTGWSLDPVILSRVVMPTVAHARNVWGYSKDGGGRLGLCVGGAWQARRHARWPVIHKTVLLRMSWTKTRTPRCIWTHYTK